MSVIQKPTAQPDPLILPVTKKCADEPYFEAEAMDDSAGSANILIYNDDILSISAIPKSSVDLIITSPPYNVDIHYNSHADDSSYGEYLEFTEQWLKNCYELAKDDGRFCLNIPLDKNKGGQQAVCADITRIAKKSRLAISRDDYLE